MRSIGGIKIQKPQHRQVTNLFRRSFGLNGPSSSFSASEEHGSSENIEKILYGMIRNEGTRRRGCNENEQRTVCESVRTNGVPLLPKCKNSGMIRWNLQLGTVPLPKANHQAHVDENIDVFDFEISPADMSALSGLNEHYSSLGSLPYA